VFKATRQHARNLATFAIIYKASMIVLRNISPKGSAKEGRYDSFFAGLLGGYAVFGRQRGSISQQVRYPHTEAKRTSGLGYPQQLTPPLDCHLCFRPRYARPRETLRRTQHAPTLFPHHP
jgi:hypothetical protein